MPTLAQTLPITPAITRADSLRDLPEGADALVQQLHLQATASVRAYSRQAHARALADDYLRRELVNVASPTPRHIATLLRLEAGGVGGPGGYTGDATRRMSAFGRVAARNAGAGPAWTSAIQAAAAAAAAEGGDAHAYASSDTTTPEDVRAIMLAIEGDDLEWPLAYALREAYSWRHDVARSTAWAALARDVAAQCEPDSLPGKLAQRYRLDTLRPLLSASAQLPAEVIADMVGMSEESVLGRIDAELNCHGSVQFWIGPITVVIEADLGTHPEAVGDRMLRVRIETRTDGSDEELSEALRRAWESAGMSMVPSCSDEVARLCAELQRWAMAPALRWPEKPEPSAAPEAPPPAVQ